MSSSGSQHTIRRDIEGLRALAVIAVVVGHVTPAALRGAFTGVDVFFVISGYLIGMHLLEDIQAGQFSFLRFYGRRARRILPALITVLLAVWGIGWMVLSAAELAALGKHIAAATVFSNNLLLWSQTGYFDQAATSKPLLHLWSLGVEEQFYLLVPLLLWLGSTGRLASVRWVTRLTVLSLLLTVLRAEPSFYLLDTRFWELGAGVLLGYLRLRADAVCDGTATLGKADYRELVGCAVALMFAAMLRLGSRQQAPWSAAALLSDGGLAALFILGTSATQIAGAYRRKGTWQRLVGLCQRHERGLREAAAVAGAALMGVAVVATSSIAWPGPQTLLPVLGTVLIIAAGPATRLSRILGCRPLVFVGGISYPLYLWHWPAIVFWRMLSYDASLPGSLVPVLAAVLLAWATRTFIESPVRFGTLCGAAVPRAPIWAVSLGLLGTGAIGVSAMATAGYPTRFSPGLRAIADWSVPHEDASWRATRCYFYPSMNIAFAAECDPAVRPGVPRVLLWGDSHAAELYPGLMSLREREDFDVIQWTAAGCPPTRIEFALEEDNCPAVRAWALRELSLAAPDTVLLAGAWEIYLERGVSESAIVTATLEDIRWLQASGVRRIVVFGPGPTWNASLPVDMFRYMSLRRTERIPERLGRVSAAVRHLEAALAAQAAATHVVYVSLLDQFCDSQGCRTLGREGAPHPDLLFRDRDHLTDSGSRLLIAAAECRIFPSASCTDPRARPGR